MYTCRAPEVRTNNKRCGRFLFGLIGVILSLTPVEHSQIYSPPPPPEQPFDYGKVVLNNYSSGTDLGPVVFDHWLHRAKFTCRLCHVDLGFGMRANGTDIAASSLREGHYCGACHDGKRLFEGRPIFPACSYDPQGRDCNRCHSLGKRGRKYHYWSFTAKLPKSDYGVDWEAAESEGKIKLVDSLEGIAVKKTFIQTSTDFSIKAPLLWTRPISFSHEKHAHWSGCNMCHPEVFPSAPKAVVQSSMFVHMEGRYCGACHGKVAFPLNNCSKCHPSGSEAARGHS